MAVAVPNDSFELINGLSDDLQLSVREVGELLDIHPRTLQRRQETGRLEEAELLKAQMVEEAFDFATRALGDAEAARRWLFSELPALDFERPIDLLGSIKGYERVKALLGQIVFGSY
ncbi:MAG TPA: antitoxin Xre/MbcA/ParS toxin-binding domain-containing protein [Trueperaceae bacterium]|nr:antitoxin Xre/MbcA/ParS toxin-binding domain-containing protein [Trueperaceae bacterium]